MKFNLQKVCTAIVFGGMIFGAGAQINFKSNDITFRSSSNYDKATYHYGDLDLSITPHAWWGWLYANKITDYGNADIYGNLYVYGAKNFIHPHPTDTTKAIKYIAVEAGEAVTMARGLGKTNSGSVVIDLPEHFGLVTNSEAPLTVLLTPEKTPVVIYVAEKSKERITVVMKTADFREFGDAEFSWQVCGVRNGYEKEETIVDAETLIGENGNNTPLT